MKKLAGKRLADPATERDLRMAMVTMRTRFIVGLMDKMEESIHRFNTAMGIDESTEQNQKCMIHFFGDHKIKNQEQYKRNSHEHPKVC